MPLPPTTTMTSGSCPMRWRLPACATLASLPASSRPRPAPPQCPAEHAPCAAPHPTRSGRCRQSQTQGWSRWMPSCTGCRPKWTACGRSAPLSSCRLGRKCVPWRCSWRRRRGSCTGASSAGGACWRCRRESRPSDAASTTCSSSASSSPRSGSSPARQHHLAQAEACSQAETVTRVLLMTILCSIAALTPCKGAMSRRPIEMVWATTR
mmetsp:Transcript_32460/g.65843  ORF Transcript_32460/g.65843 Transcript_32460/m.65843 type:complete len:209 (+) Transcript_32460:1151-1777(+)